MSVFPLASALEASDGAANLSTVFRLLCPAADAKTGGSVPTSRRRPTEARRAFQTLKFNRDVSIAASATPLKEDAALCFSETIYKAEEIASESVNHH